MSSVAITTLQPISTNAPDPPNALSPPSSPVLAPPNSPASPVAPVAQTPISLPQLDISQISNIFNGVECKTVTNVLKCIGANNKQCAFVAKIQQMLAVIPPSDANYNNEIVSFVLEALEHYFVKSKSGKLKLALAVQILKPYFKYDERLAVQIIELILPSIPKTNVFRRTGHYLSSFF